MNIVEYYSKNAQELTDIWYNDPKVNELMKNFRRALENPHLSYCIVWSKKIFKNELLRILHLEYHDFRGYVKSERKSHGKTGTNNSYSTVIEFDCAYSTKKVIWKLNLTNSLRKKLSGSFRIICVTTDGSKIHMVFQNNNGKCKYIKFDYCNIEVQLK